MLERDEPYLEQVTSASIIHEEINLKVNEDEEPTASHGKLLIELLKIAVPCAIGLVLSELPFQTILVYVGKLGDKQQLAGAGLAVSMINCLCLSVTVGISSVLETLVS